MSHLNHFKHPGDKLTISPIYTLEENAFSNDTDLILSPAVQGTALQLKVGGLAVEAIDGEMNIATAQSTADLSFEPVKLVDINFLDDKDVAQFPLRGFEPVKGEVLTVESQPGE